MDVKSRPVSISDTYKNKPEYKSVESKVDNLYYLKKDII